MSKRSRLCVLLQSSALVTSGLLAFLGSVNAQDATWNLVGTGDWNTDGNWVPPTVPTATATFGVSTQTAVSFSEANTAIETINFAPAASAYIFTVGAPGFQILNLTGSGIVNNSGVDQNFHVLSNGQIAFINSASAGGSNVRLTLTDGFAAFVDTSTAGSAVITANHFSGIFFGDNSTAGNARITLNNFSQMDFSQNSTAGNATIVNNGDAVNFAGTFFTQAATAGNATITNDGGFTAFFNTSTAGSATIINNGSPSDSTIFGLTQFGDSSSAGNSTITNDLGATVFTNTSTAANATIRNIGLNAGNVGFTTFTGSSTAASAHITNDAFGITSFRQNSTAANATIVTNSGGLTQFRETASGGNARLITTAGGQVDISRLTSAGTTMGSIEGAGTYFLGSKLLTVGSNNLSTEVSGVIADGGFSAETGGALTKVGTGTLLLSGDNTYTGQTTVENGALLVTGSVVGPVNVFAGATLGGTGAVGTTTVNGTLAPGLSIGTLTVNGQLTFGSNATYLVEINPTSGDRTVVTGAATLDGTVQVFAAAGFYAPGVTYNILTANGGLSGTFSGLITNFNSFTFLTPQLTYDANNVFFTLGRSNVTFASVGQTANQIATGAAADTLGFGNKLFDALAFINPEQARQAFDLLSGEVHANAASVLLDESRYIRDAVTGRLRQSYAGAAPLVALGPAGPVVAYASEPREASTVLGYAGGKSPLFKAVPPPAPQGPVFAAWSQTIGAWGQFDGDGNAAGVKRTLGGFLTGADATFANTWRVGLAGGYTRSWFDVDERRSTGNSDNYHVAIYGGGQFGPLGVRTGAALTWHDIDTRRDVVFPGFAETLRAEYSARTGQVFGELGYGIALGSTAIEPFAAIAHVNLDTDRFTETGGAAALTGENSFAATFTTFGLRASSILSLTDAMAVTARGSIGWRHAFGDVTPAATFAFAAGAAPFTIAGVPLAEDSAVVEAGIEVAIAANATVGVSYAGQLAENVQDHAVRGKALWRF